MTFYSPAPGVTDLVDQLVPTTHPHLEDAPIVSVFRDTAVISGGRITLAKARLISGLNAYLAALASGDLTGHPEFGHSFFCIEVAADQWADLDDHQRLALVDHELCHLDIWENEDGERGLWIRGHDVEEFIAVARRHGAWGAALRSLVNVCSVPR